MSDIKNPYWTLFRLIIAITPLILILIYGAYSLLILYVLLGAAFYAVTRLKKLSNPNSWLSDLTVSLIMWPIMLLLWEQFYEKKKKKTLLDEFNGIIENNPSLKVYKQYFDEMSKDGTTQDVIPTGYGRFGLDVTNPVPTNGIFGSNAYLGRLRDHNGNPILCERLGSTFCDNIENMIDAYSLKDSDGKSLGTIYVSPYHKVNSKKAPDGFNIR